MESLAALEALYDAYHREAIGVAYRMLGSREAAEDVVQDAFLSAWRSLATYAPDRGSTRTWFLSLVRHRVIDRIRSERRRPVIHLDGRTEVADERDHAQDAVNRADGFAARAALAQLAPHQQEAIHLAYFGGLSHSEIADALGEPVGTIKSRIRIGLDHLRAALARGQANYSANN